MSDTPRTTMNGKPVLERDAKSIVNFESGFGHKLLCDGLTFNTSDACPFTCTFCYVPAMSHKMLHGQLAAAGLKHEEVVIRRTDAVVRLREQLEAVKSGRGRKAELFQPRERPLVIYSSTNSDVAGNVELCGETVAACMTILEMTPWDIRLLSKSNLLPRIAKALDEADVAVNRPQGHIPYSKRVIYGVSTGTLDDKLAASFEQGTALVSKRIKSLHWLQDNGYRTFGMICPSLPLPNTRAYREFAGDMRHALRAEFCEQVWAEVMNVRGESMKRTVAALKEAKYFDAALALEVTSTNKAIWEQYSRDTFEGHAPFYEPGKLRFLQYVNPQNIAWWKRREFTGAILLGAAAGE